jgi:hypothetical protein
MPENFLSMPDGAMRACQIRDGSNEPLYFFVSCKARIIWLTKFINSRVDGARAAVPHPDTSHHDTNASFYTKSNLKICVIQIKEIGNKKGPHSK